MVSYKILDVEIKKLEARRKAYKDEILTVISEEPRYKVAYHYNCCDGIVSCALFKKIFEKENLVYIPIDYSLLSTKETRTKIIKSNWYAIVDLEPFNENELELYVDHHISAVNKHINARKIHFEAGAPSASYILNKCYNDILPPHLKELAKMTLITDTASYKIPAPLEMEEDENDFTYDSKIWFLEDACKTTFGLKDHDIITDILYKQGWAGLWDLSNLETKGIQSRIFYLREGRKSAYKISQELEISEFMILIDHAMHFNITYIAHELMHRGATGVAYLTQYPDFIRISLRLSKKLSEKEIDYYRVDHLANSMGGGGHKPASGAQLDSLDLAIKKIEQWAQEKNLKTKIVDLRNMA